MDIKRLPPSILVALGLAGCGPGVDPDDDSAGEATGSAGSSGEVSTSACLDVPIDTTGELTTGPCLGQELTTTGPCLGPEVTTSGEVGSGSDTGTDSGGSGSDDAGDDSTTGPCLAPKGDAPPPDTAASSASARAEIVERLREAGILPPDIADKLDA